MNPYYGPWALIKNCKYRDKPTATHAERLGPPPSSGESPAIHQKNHYTTISRGWSVVDFFIILD